MYYAMNSLMLREEPLPDRELWIQQRASTWDQWYTPYVSRWNRWGMEEQDEQRPNGYGYEYYEIGEVNIDWENVPSDFEGNRDWYFELQEAYYKEAANAYTDVPTEDLPRLVSLCEENPAESLEEITATILSLLQTNMVYTREPGLFPMNEDPVEYFLFEGQEGYCQHFASAATLMYRLYGIPTRYAAGYAVSPSAFTQQEDGTYLATVTDESAHAWPEIFLEDYGWVPIEATPSGINSFAYPGMDQELLNEYFTNQTLHVETIQHSQVADDEVDAPSDLAQTFSIQIDFPGWKTVIRYLAYALLLTVVLFIVYRGIRLRAIKRMEIRKLFSRMKKALQFAGFFRKSGISEEKMLLELPQVIPGFTDAKADRLLAVLQEASFGSSPVGESRENEVRESYRQVMKALYQKLPFWKKPIFKYGKTFL